MFGRKENPFFNLKQALEECGDFLSEERANEKKIQTCIKSLSEGRKGYQKEKLGAFLEDVLCVLEKVQKNQKISDSELQYAYIAHMEALYLVKKEAVAFSTDVEEFLSYLIAMRDSLKTANQLFCQNLKTLRNSTEEYERIAESLRKNQLYLAIVEEEVKNFQQIKRESDAKKDKETKANKEETQIESLSDLKEVNSNTFCLLGKGESSHESSSLLGEKLINQDKPPEQKEPPKQEVKQEREALQEEFEQEKAEWLDKMNLERTILQEEIERERVESQKNDQIEKAATDVLQKEKEELLLSLKKKETEIQTFLEKEKVQKEQQEALQEQILEQEYESIRLKEELQHSISIIQKLEEEKEKPDKGSPIKIPQVVWFRSPVPLPEEKQKGFFKGKNAEVQNDNQEHYQTLYREKQLTCKRKAYTECVRIPLLPGACLLDGTYLGNIMNCSEGKYNNLDLSLYEITLSQIDRLSLISEIMGFSEPFLQELLQVDYTVIFARISALLIWYYKKNQEHMTINQLIDIKKSFNQMVSPILLADKKRRQVAYQSALLADHLVTTYATYGYLLESECEPKKELVSKEILSGEVIELEREAKEFLEHEFILEEAKKEMMKLIKDIVETSSLLGEK